MKSIRFKVILILCLCSLLPLLLFFGYLFRESRTRLIEKTQADFQEISLAISHQVLELVQPLEEGLMFLTKLEILQDQLTEDWDKDSRLRNLLSEFQKEHSILDELMVIRSGENGEMYFSSTHPKRITLPVLESESPHKLQTHPVPVLESLITGQKVIALLLPFFTEDEKMHWLQANLSLEFLFEKIKNLRIAFGEQNHSQFIAILDSHGKIIYSPYQNIPADFPQKDGKIFHFLFSGEDFLCFSIPMNMTGWRVLIARKSSLVFLELNQILYTALMAIFVSLPLIFILSFLFSRQITGPVTSLAHAAKEIAQGNYAPQISCHTEDEIGFLAESMAAMGRSICEKEKGMKGLNDRLQGLASSLEDRVRQKTAQIVELLEDNRLLSRILSHDIAGYLTSISLLCRDIHTPEAQEEILKISREACKILGKFREIQAIEDGKLQTISESILVRDAFEDAFLLIRNKLERKKLILDLGGIERDVKIEVDREWFVLSVLNNLLSNAIKYSFEGGKIEVFSQTGERVQIIIRDYGCKIEKERIPFLFFPGKKTSTRGTQGEIGTGFGLPIVKKWVEHFKGEIFVESSQEEDGTRVILYFPLAGDIAT